MLEQFGPYTLLKQLGSGGMAEVFLAQAPGVDGTPRLLAIKRLFAPFNRDDQLVSMLADEARVSVWLTHPNIVQVLDFGRVNHTYFIAMEYVDGCDLWRYLRNDDNSATIKLDLKLALYIMTQVMEALAFAHNRVDVNGQRLNIIHRDVSPHNILLTRDGAIKLADFGLARASISTHLSHAGVIRGKFAYMPKEQAQGLEIDQRVDLFGAGVTFYEMLTGTKPFSSTNLAQQLYQLEMPIVPPSQHNPIIPVEIDELALQALSPSPEFRYQTATDMLSDLKHAIGSFGQLPPLRDVVARSVASICGPSDVSNASIPHLSLHNMPIAAASLMATEILAAQRALSTSVAPPDTEQTHTDDVLEAVEPEDSVLPTMAWPVMPQTDPNFDAPTASTIVELRPVQLAPAPTGGPPNAPRPQNARKTEHRKHVSTLKALVIAGLLFAVGLLIGWFLRGY